MSSQGRNAITSLVKQARALAAEADTLANAVQTMMPYMPPHVAASARESVRVVKATASTARWHADEAERALGLGAMS